MRTLLRLFNPFPRYPTLTPEQKDRRRRANETAILILAMLLIFGLLYPIVVVVGGQ